MGQSTSTLVTQSEMETLFDLYQSLNGDNWVCNAGWCKGEKEATEWHGIKMLMGHIVAIELPRNNLRGNLPHSIGNLRYLRTLNLAGNKITGSIPKSIGNLSTLVSLDLSCNSIKSIIPEEIRSCQRLEKMDLQQNFIYGNIPTKIGQMMTLKTIFLQHNKIQGMLPDSIGYLTSLRKFSVRGNCLTGSIPNSIGGLRKLEVLSLRNNDFTGEIPESIGNCSSLICLNLSSNKFSGEIPESLGGLPNLEYLYLFENELSGNIPSSLMLSTKLKEADFRFNDDSLNKIPRFIETCSTLDTIMRDWNERRRHSNSDTSKDSIESPEIEVTTKETNLFFKKLLSNNENKHLVESKEKFVVESNQFSNHSTKQSLSRDADCATLSP